MLNKRVYIIIGIIFLLLFIFSDSTFVERIGKISTVLLTVLTAGYVLLTYWILRSSRESGREQARPYIVASLPLDGFEIILSVKNIGNRPASNVVVEFQPPLNILSKDFDTAGKPLLSQAFMQPNFEVRNPIAVTIDVLKLKPEQKIFRVLIAYRDLEGQQFSSDYRIDLNSYIYNDSVVQYNIEHYLSEIANSLKKQSGKR